MPYCSKQGCLGFGKPNYCGLCPPCWVNATPEERAILRGEEPPVKEIVTYREIVTPPREPLLAVLKFVWCAAVTAALVLLMYWRTR